MQEKTMGRGGGQEVRSEKEWNLEINEEKKAEGESKGTRNEKIRKNMAQMRKAENGKKA